MKKGPYSEMFSVHKTQIYWSHKKYTISSVLPKGLRAASDLSGISVYVYICRDSSLILTSLCTHLTSNIHTVKGNQITRFTIMKGNIFLFNFFFLLSIVLDLWSLNKIQIHHCRRDTCITNHKFSPELEKVFKT